MTTLSSVVGQVAEDRAAQQRAMAAEDEARRVLRAQAALAVRKAAEAALAAEPVTEWGNPQWQVSDDGDEWKADLT